MSILLNLCDDDKHGTAGGTDSGKTKSVGGVDKDNIKYLDTDLVPGNNGITTFDFTGSGGMILSWTAATDVETASNLLEYLVYNTTGFDVKGVGDVLTYGTPIGDYTRDITVKYLTNLTLGEEYNFCVMVRDEADNKEIYDIVTPTVPLNLAPEPGNGGQLFCTDESTTSVILSWTPATDDNTPQSELQYLVYSTWGSPPLTSLQACEQDGLAFGTYQTNINSIEVTGLDDGSFFYFNVVVKDSDGGRTIYTNTWNTPGEDDPPIPGASGEILTTVEESTPQINLSWSYATDDFTSQADLEYLVYYSESVDISSVDLCETSGTAVGSYTKNINSKQVTGLTLGTSYYFNVVAKDATGNKSAYSSVNDTTVSDNPPAPGGSGVISSTYTGTSQVNLSWNLATDDFTSQSNLQYRAYYSTSDNISTVSTCLANGTAVGNYQSNINSKNVTGLSSNTQYYFNVIVKDNHPYMAIYQMNDFTTVAIDNPPVAGNSGTIEVGTVSSSGVTLSWTKATDDESLQENLEYLIYYSTSDNLGTVSDCETNGTAFGAYTKDISTQTVNSLSSETKYYFNLLVKDQGENKICYQTTSATTEAAAFEIGSLWAGGIVIYLDGTGHGLVCALTDQSASAEWGCYNTALTGCEDQTIGSGQANTTAIMNGCSTADIAARVCDEYDDGTYSDWFLPSYLEGQQIANNLTAINNGLTANSGDAFSGNYWTSTQANYDQKGIRPDRNLDAWTIFAIGGPPFDDKNHTNKVRAIRKF